ncbi:MAG: DUF1059 domain-containing protein [Candidatus Parvarchaeota archaeon]|nr:DUF1059 domain-containing protein [Candidatus Parvarchaeota archaeon]
MSCLILCGFMAYKFSCRATGLDCDFTAEAGTMDELMPKVAEHGKQAHGMEQISDETMQKVKAAITEEPSSESAGSEEKADETSGNQ